MFNKDSGLVKIWVRLLTSKNSDSIKWANNLYKNFKMKNK